MDAEGIVVEKCDVTALVGHPELISQYAEKLLGFGFAVISKYRRKRDGRFDDITSEMQWELLQALTRIANGKVENPTVSYIGTAINLQVLKFLTCDKTIKRSQRTQERADVVSVEPLAGQNLRYDGFPDSDLRELVRVCTETPRERFIIGLRLDGYSDVEIAEQFGDKIGLKTRQAIQQIRSQVCAKIQSKLAGLN